MLTASRVGPRLFVAALFALALSADVSQAQLGGLIKRKATEAAKNLGKDNPRETTAAPAPATPATETRQPTKAPAVAPEEQLEITAERLDRLIAAAKMTFVLRNGIVQEGSGPSWIQTAEAERTTKISRLNREIDSLERAEQAVSRSRSAWQNRDIEWQRCEQRVRSATEDANPRHVDEPPPALMRKLEAMPPAERDRFLMRMSELGERWEREAKGGDPRLARLYADSLFQLTGVRPDLNAASVEDREDARRAQLVKKAVATKCGSQPVLAGPSSDDIRMRQIALRAQRDSIESAPGAAAKEYEKEADRLRYQKAGMSPLEYALMKERVLAIASALKARESISGFATASEVAAVRARLADVKVLDE